MIYETGFICTNFQINPNKKELSLKEIWEYYKKHKPDIANVSKKDKWRTIDKVLSVCNVTLYEIVFIIILLLLDFSLVVVLVKQQH
jgi:hypothetical protein